MLTVHFGNVPQFTGFTHHKAQGEGYHEPKQNRSQNHKRMMVLTPTLNSGRDLGPCKRGMYSCLLNTHTHGVRF